MILAYLIVCIVFSLIIRKKNDFWHTSSAVMATIIATPLFGRKLYNVFEKSDIDKINSKKSFVKTQRDRDLQRINELFEGVSDNEIDRILREEDTVSIEKLRNRKLKFVQ